MSKIAALTAQLAALRAKKAEVTAEFDAKDRALKQAITLVETAIRADMNATGTKSARTDAGLVSLTPERIYHVTDWSALYDHIKQTDNFDLLHKRLGTGAVKSMVADDGTMPPGVQFTDAIKVNFTKPKD